jgi:thioredoxin-dependent peroxiredoxin
MLTVGTVAPDFTLQDQNGTYVSLHDYHETYTLVYFYPKDDTPGCTKEACTIAEVYDEFEALNITVLGISKDSPKSHKKFAEKYKLPFRLLSDSEGEMIEEYGAWQNKSMFGRSFMGVARISYLIDGEGVIVKVYPNVDPAAHALQILKDVKEITKTAA